MGEQISQAWYLAVLKAASLHGEPLPQRVLEIGDKQGWLARLNPTNDAIDGIQPLQVSVSLREMPVGVIYPDGGTMIVGAEEDFIEWLKS